MGTGPLRAGTGLARAGVDARVVGSFLMHARVISAYNVRGEYPGQRLLRRWQFTARSCLASMCRVLVLRRQRSDERFSTLTLRRTAPGHYAGRGRFFVALRCRGRDYPHGAVAPYRITLTITRTRSVEGVRFARRLRAHYINRRRIDHTPCPLGPSHDAARYWGVAVLPVPSPPSAAFSYTATPAGTTVAFRDTSRPGANGAALIARRWNFGDPASGTADTSTAPDPTHTFSAPGSYSVTLTDYDANGLSGSVTQTVSVPAP